MWVNDSKEHWEDLLRQHVKVIHLQSMQLPEGDRPDFFDFYEATIQNRAQSIMPAVASVLIVEVFDMSLIHSMTTLCTIWYAWCVLNRKRTLAFAP